MTKERLGTVNSEQEERDGVQQRETREKQVKDDSLGVCHAMLSVYTTF